MTDRADVLVVGAGPVGLTAACLLADFGLSVLVVDSKSGPSPYPRAVGIHPRTMEVWRRAGIADLVRAVAAPPERSGAFAFGRSLGDPEMLEVRLRDDPELAREHSPEHGAFCPQHVYEQVLRDAAVSRPLVELRYDCRLDHLEQQGNEVRTGDVTASWCVAADGARSTVRQLLGLTETGRPPFAQWVSTHVRAPLTEHAGRGRAITWLGEESCLGSLSLAAADGSEWTWTTKRNAGIDPLASLRSVAGDPDLPVEVLSALEWDYEQAVADTWRSDRVFLAGDAAHRFPPHGGLGMNSGVQDVENLAWKLAAVHRGLSPDSLLDTYQDERRPVAQRCSELALRNTAALDAMWPAPATPEALALQREHFFTSGHQLGTVYRSAAVVPDGATPPEQTISTYTPSCTPGARAPHAWIEPGRSTVDACAGGFALLAADRAWNAVADQVTVELVEADSIGVPPDGAVLVRPDGHIAARLHDARDPVGSLKQVLHALSFSSLLRRGEHP